MHAHLLIQLSRCQVVVHNRRLETRITHGTHESTSLGLQLLCKRLSLLFLTPDNLGASPASMCKLSILNSVTLTLASANLSSLHENCKHAYALALDLRVSEREATAFASSAGQSLGQPSAR